MKKRLWVTITAFLFVFLLMFLFVACDSADTQANDSRNESSDQAAKECTHTWKSATCAAPKTCSKCQLTEGAALGHAWVSATCTAPKTCSRCQKTSGEAVGHSWEDATCTTPKTCSSCQATSGTALEHDYTETVTVAATCQGSGTKKFSCSNCTSSYTEAYELEKYDATSIHDMCAKSICEITTYDKSGSALALGSGFVYSDDGKIVTNFHVIDGAYSIKINLNGTTYTVQYVLTYDKDIDAAILKIDAKNLESVKICDKTHKVGEEVYAFGSSKGLTATFSRGIITYSNREMDGVVYTQHDAAISSGNSGGPLINQFGEVIGINTLTIKDSQNLNFAINISELSNLSKETKLTVSEFYEKECDVFSKLKNHIVEKGTYKTSSSAGAYYVLNLGSFYSSDYSYKYTRYAYYYVAKDYITLDFASSSGSYVYFKITEPDGVYDWNYFDDSNYVMSGILYANTYTTDTLLGYNYNNISYSSLRATIRELASTYMSALLSYIDKDFKTIGVTAEDLGFYYY